MKDSDRVFLVSSLKEKWNTFDTTVFQGLADGVSQEILLASLSRDVYKLTAEDIQKIATIPGQISGKIRLTDTYNKYASIFVTIPITRELTNLLTINRQTISY
ncbi:hypothetical protein PDE_01126 [Penicillium oxalicum 114-2]|uniref:Uncharacterized protein n=1 Tax=Penicillium oxalicum (strain 114-2 / CGMCC 5302) TaxID=933388 RepID=S7Z6K1_PENO1|nr:hypothetical protein PDE_01126 [Penicillium oxalicum 114-2]